MSGFKYEITKHPAEDFSQLVYFCTEQGECKVNDLPPDQVEVFRDALNERGGQGWELVQLIFGKDGIVAVWKSAL